MSNRGQLLGAETFERSFHKECETCPALLPKSV